MTRKLKVLTLIIVTLSIVFGTQVAASLPIARPDVMYPEKSFTLDNPEVVRTIKAMTETLDSDELTIIGPFNKYVVNDDGSVELRFAHYNIFTRDGTPHLLSVYLNPDGDICSTLRHNVQDRNDFCNEDHIIIGNQNLCYLVTNSGVVELDGEYKFFASDDAQVDAMRKKKVNDLILGSSAYLLRESNPEIMTIKRKSTSYY